MLGSWKINVVTGGMPEKVATAFGQLNEVVGAEYSPIAYLGSQVVNGTNHAVLAEQTLICGKDIKNVVLVIFRETKEGVTVTDIERVVESGDPVGGIAVDVKVGKDIPDEAKAAFEKAFDGFVGSKVDLFALLGTQVTTGMNYIFAAEISPVVEDPEKTVALVTVNAMKNTVSFVDILTSKCDVMGLGYAFTWLRRQDTSLGKPLGEWP